MKCPFVIKICSKCKRLLVANTMNFHKKESGLYNLDSRCKNCKNKQGKINYKINKKIEKKNNPFDNINPDKVWNHCPFCIKVCSKCGRILVANEMNFNKGKGNYGLKYQCKRCRSIDEKQYYQKHKKEKSKYHKRYYKNNKEKIKKHQQEHKDEKAEYDKIYRKNNPHVKFNSHAKRKQLKKDQGNGVSKEQWFEMMNFFNWCCAYSGEYIGGDSNKRTLDHIVALINGGEHEIWNCVPMYSNYNYSKNSKNMIDWYIQQDFFDIDRLLKIYEWIEYAYNKWN